MKDRNSLLLQKQNGNLDGVIQDYLVGWVWNPLTPDAAVCVDIYINGQFYETVIANQFREDLLKAGIGNGSHSFTCRLNTENLDSTYLISVRLAGTESEIPNSPMWIGSAGKLQPGCHLTTLKLDPHNIAFSLESLDAARIDHLLIDINDTCNANCVYCPNSRSSKRIELDQFKEMLAKSVKQADILQFGCGQEPTADMRLPDFYRALHTSKFRPKRLTMITNATLLHRHDVGLFRDCGLTDIQVSIDTVDSEINALTRRGTELSQIMRNLQDFRKKCPKVGIMFSVVVNALTINKVEALLKFGESLRVQNYYFREVFDYCPPHVSPRSSDYRDWLKKISLPPGEFQKMQQRLRRHRAFKKIHFNPAERLDSVLQDMKQADGTVRVC